MGFAVLNPSYADAGEVGWVERERNPITSLRGSACVSRWSARAASADLTAPRPIVDNTGIGELLACRPAATRVLAGYDRQPVMPL